MNKKLGNTLVFKFLGRFFMLLFLASFLAPIFAHLILEVEHIPMHGVESVIQGLPIVYAVRTACSTIAIGFILIKISSKHIVRPIEELVKGVIQVAGGDLSVEIDTRGRQDELGVLIESFNKMVLQLSKNEYLHKEFVSNVSHEFKTPISAILGYIELLEDDNISKQEVEKYKQVIKKQALKLSDLSVNLLRLSELEESEELQLSTYQLDEQIREVLVVLQPDWESKNIDLNIHMEETCITADKMLLYQVWMNLINNAIKFTHEYGQVFIRVEKKEEHILVMIEDTGIGMSEDALVRCTERFYKEDMSRNTVGAGLGLSIVKKILELHQADLNVVSVGSKGCEVGVRFELKN